MNDPINGIIVNFDVPTPKFNTKYEISSEIMNAANAYEYIRFISERISFGAVAELKIRGSEESKIALKLLVYQLVENKNF